MNGRLCHPELANAAEDGTKVLPVNYIIQFRKKIAPLREPCKNVLYIKEALNYYHLSYVDLSSTCCMLRWQVRRLFEAALRTSVKKPRVCIRHS